MNETKKQQNTHQKTTGENNPGIQGDVVSSSLLNQRIAPMFSGKPEPFPCLIFELKNAEDQNIISSMGPVYFIYSLYMPIHDKCLSSVIFISVNTFLLNGQF